MLNSLGCIATGLPGLYIRPLITSFILHSSTAPENTEVKVFKASGEICLLISQLIKFFLGSFDISACNTFFFRSGAKQGGRSWGDMKWHRSTVFKPEGFIPGLNLKQSFYPPILQSFLLACFSSFLHRRNFTEINGIALVQNHNDF